MKTIKIRAWDEDDGEMLDAVVVNEGAQEPDFVLNLYPDGPPLNIRKHQFMLWTGLKDKNGVEIYEGDIVIEPSISTNQVVFWSTEHAAFKLGSRGQDTQYDKRNSFWPEQCEVIGNIYQNKELLK